jgi:predicted CopG family antitoxin
MRVREKLLRVFNHYKVEVNEETLDIAKDFKFKFNSKSSVWESLPREIMGEKISQLFKRFIDEYKKHYRVDVAAKEFYQLSDEEIEDMFDELPYFNKTFIGRETYKPNAANFLKERIWKQDYPNKPQRDRSKKASILTANNWDEYINGLPESQRSAAEAYRQLINFESFKSLVNDNKKG